MLKCFAYRKIFPIFAVVKKKEKDMRTNRKTKNYTFINGKKYRILRSNYDGRIVGYVEC